MAIVVNFYDEEIEFPDGTSDEVINNALRDEDARRESNPAVEANLYEGDDFEYTSEDTSIFRDVGDIATSFASGIPKALGAITSLGSLVPYVHHLADPASEALQSTGEYMDDALLSDRQKEINQELSRRLQEAAGTLGDDASIGDYIEAMAAQGGEAGSFIADHPAQVINLVASSLPYLVGGGAITKGIKGGAELAGFKKIADMSRATGAAVGEGSIAAGEVVKNIIADTDSVGEYSVDRLAAIPAGIGTAALSRLGAALSAKSGVSDIDVAIANKVAGESLDSAANASSKGLLSKVATGTAIETGEEFLQSAQEKVFENLGTGKPVLTDVGGDAVMGAAAGMGQGGAVNLYTGLSDKKANNKAVKEQINVDKDGEEMVNIYEEDQPSMYEEPAQDAGMTEEEWLTRNLEVMSKKPEEVQEQFAGDIAKKKARLEELQTKVEEKPSAETKPIVDETPTQEEVTEEDVKPKDNLPEIAKPEPELVELTQKINKVKKERRAYKDDFDDKQGEYTEEHFDRLREWDIQEAELEAEYYNKAAEKLAKSGNNENAQRNTKAAQKWQKRVDELKEIALKEKPSAETKPIVEEFKTKAGKPFKTKATIEKQLKAKGLTNQYTVEEKDGGFVGVTKPQEQEKAQKPSKPQEQVKDDKIEDFGEKIGGAVKDTYTLKESLDNDVEISSLPLSKAFPKPDHQKLIAEGTDARVVAFMMYLRNLVPSKPRKKGYKLDRWVKQVEEARMLSSEALANSANFAKASTKYLSGTREITLKDGTTRALSNEGFNDEIVSRLTIAMLADKVSPDNLDELIKYKYLGWSKWSRFVDGVAEDVSGYSIEYAGKNAGLGGWGNRKDFKTKEEALDYIVQQVKGSEATTTKRQTKFDVWSERGKDGYFVGKKVAAGKFVELAKGFKTGIKAREYIRENQELLEEQLKKKKDIGSFRRPDNEPRVGEDHRKGKNISPEDFAEAFGFRGVEFGNWVENTRRQEDLNNAYDGLVDLTNLLGIPTKAISLNGELGLAFGARGRSKAKAHYESTKVVINLTKKKGSGSLAHEWWHAMDNYFAKMEGDNTIDRVYLTEAKLRKTRTRDTKAVSAEEYSAMTSREQFSARRGGGAYRDVIDSDFGVRREVFEAFQALTKSLSKETEILKRAKAQDKTRSKDYWSTIREVTARSFERYVIIKLKEQEYSSDYLANVITQEAWEKIGGTVDNYLYPLDDEMEVVNNAYDNLFDTLETKETDKGVALFQTKIDARQNETNLEDESFEEDNSADINTLKRVLSKRTGESPDTVEVRQGNLAMPADTRRDIEETFGKRIVAIRTGEGVKWFNGAILVSRPDVIYVSEDAESPHLTVVGHEMLHAMKIDNPELYQQLLKTLTPYIQNTYQYKAILDKQAAENNAQPETLDAVREEIFADILGDNFASEIFWSKVAIENESTFKKIHAWIKRWIAKLVEKLGGKKRVSGIQGEEKFDSEGRRKNVRYGRSVHYTKDLVKAQDAMAKVMRKYVKARSGDKDALRNLKDDAIKFMVAYHGTPHDFDEFSTDSIGTGEGNQAYGWGLYFAGNKEVAEWYKKKLSRSEPYEILDEMVSMEDNNYSYDLIVQDMAAEVMQQSGDIQKALDIFDAEALRRREKGDTENIIEADAIEWVTSRIAKAIGAGFPSKIDVNYGKMYQVNLAPKEDEYLLWDEPLSEQSEKVKAALDEIKNEMPTEIRKNIESGYGREFDSWMESDLNRALKAWNNNVPPSKGFGTGWHGVSKYLLSKGIRGNKYLDGSSRSDGQGNYNYVIFDDKDVSVEAKFQTKGDFQEEGVVTQEAVADNKVLKYVGTNEPLKRSLEYVHIDDLVALRGEYGATYNEESWERLNKSIKDEGGLIEPIRIQVDRVSRTADVVEGNHRITVAKEMGYEWLPAEVNLQDDAENIRKNKRSDIIPSADNEVFHPSDDAEGKRRKEWLPSHGRPSRYLSDIRTIPLSDFDSDIKFQTKGGFKQEEATNTSKKPKDIKDDDVSGILDSVVNNESVKSASGVAHMVGRFMFFAPHNIIRNSIGTKTAKKLADMIYQDPDNKKSGKGGIDDIISKRFHKLGELSTRLTNILEPHKNRIGGLKKAINPVLIRALHTGQVPRKLESTAKELRAWLDDIVEYQKEAGVDIGYVKNYFPRVYDVEILLKSKKKFIQMLERNGYKDGAEDIYNKIVLSDGIPELLNHESERVSFKRDGGLFIPSSRVGEHVRTKAVRSGFQKERALDLSFTELEPFLINNVTAILSRYMNLSIKRAEYVRAFGANENELNSMVKEIMGEFKPTANMSKEQALKVIYDMADSLQGIYNTIQTPALHRLNRFALNTSILIHLPRVILASIPETFTVGALLNGNYKATLKGLFEGVKHGLNEAAGITQRLTTGKRTMSKTEATKFAEGIGIITHQALMDAIGTEFGTKDSKATNVFMKATMLETLTRMQKIAAIESFKYAVKDWSTKLDAHSVAQLKKYGISKQEAQGWAQDGFKQEGDVAVKLATAAQRFAIRAITTPTEATRSFGLQDQRLAIIFQFQSFINTFSNTFLKAVTLNFKGNKGLHKLDSLPYLVLMIALAYAMLGVRDEWKYGDNEKPYEDSTLGRWVNAVDRAGFTGQLQTIFNMFRPYKYGWGDTAAKRAFYMMGPVINDLGRILDVAISDNKEEGLDKHTKKTMQKLVPILNAIPQSATDKLLDIER